MAGDTHIISLEPILDAVALAPQGIRGRGRSARAGLAHARARAEVIVFCPGHCNKKEKEGMKITEK